MQFDSWPPSLTYFDYMLSHLLRIKMFYVLVLFFISVASAADFEHPLVTIKVYSPKGFSVSIPGKSFFWDCFRLFNRFRVLATLGVTLFAFHGKLNEELNGLEAGTWSRDITKARNGHFTFYDRDASLKIGDVLYFWTYALHNGLGYRHDNGEYVVRDYEHGSIDEVFPSKSVYEIPEPRIEVLHPKGFRVSIPGENRLHPNLSIVWTPFQLRQICTFLLFTGSWMRNLWIWKPVRGRKTSQRLKMDALHSRMMRPS